MTDDDRKAIGPDGVAVAEALGAARDFDPEPKTYGEWLTAVDRWSWTDDNREPPTCPLDALYGAAAGRHAFSLDEAPTFALVAELRRTRQERDAARQERDEAVAVAAMERANVGAVGAAWDSMVGKLRDSLGAGLPVVGGEPDAAVRPVVNAWAAAVDVWFFLGAKGPPPPCPWAALADDWRRSRAQVLAMYQEAAGIASARDAALDALAAMVRQFCGPAIGAEICEIDARGYRASAEAIEVLADAGRIVIEGGDGGRTVYGRWVR